MKRKILSLILSISLIFSNQSIKCFAENYGNETITEEFNQTLNKTFNDPNFLKEQITKAIILRKIIKFGGSIAVAVLSGFLGYTILRMIREQKYQSRNYLNTIIEEKDSTINTAMSYLEDSELKNVVSNTVNTVVNSAMDTLHKKDIMENSDLKNLVFNTVNTVVNSAMDTLHKKDFDTLQTENQVKEISDLKKLVFETVNGVVTSAMDALHKEDKSAILSIRKKVLLLIDNVKNLNEDNYKNFKTLKKAYDTLEEENKELKLFISSLTPKIDKILKEFYTMRLCSIPQKD